MIGRCLKFAADETIRHPGSSAWSLERVTMQWGSVELATSTIGPDGIGPTGDPPRPGERQHAPFRSRTIAWHRPGE
jgi:hypothetical protein